MVKNSPANTGDVGDAGLISGLGRCPGGRKGNPTQYSFLENPMDKGAWWATVHGVAKSQVQLSDWAHLYTHLSLSSESPNQTRVWSWGSLTLMNSCATII